ncbi:hypothetical protein FRB90_009848, partial [Tulasnella sp. 427]
MVQSYVIRNVFEDGIGYNSQITGDGITLPLVETMDNSACVEILRGAQLADRAQKKPGGILGIMSKAATASRQGKSLSDKKDEDMLAEITAACDGHSSFVANPPQSSSRTLFAINHYSGPCTYDVNGFVDKDVDLLDSAFVQVLRRSTDGFVSRLVSGPSMATEVHPKDAVTVVQAQVSSRALREPTPIANSPTQPEDLPVLDPSKIYPVTTQVNFDTTRLLRHLDNTSQWTVACIRPNDSGLPNSFDKRRVKSQIRSLLLPDHVVRRRVEYVVDYDHDEFCDRYSLEGAGEIAAERIRAFMRPLNWMTEGSDYAIGHRRVFLGYTAWKAIDDGLRADEKDERLAAKEEEAASAVGHGSVRGHDTTRSRDWSGGDVEDMDDPAPRGQGRNMSGYMDVNAPAYSPGTLQTTPVSGAYPDTPTNPFRHHADPSMENGWSERGSAWDKDDDDGRMDKEPLDPASKEGGFQVKEATAVEEVPTTAARKWWVRFVWAMTFWIPTFLLSSIGRMKRPDIQLAWREKLTICLIIFWMCGIVLFATIFLGQVICPQFTKAWTLNELKAHTADDDLWVAVYGVVYDISKFWRGNHGTTTWVSDSATFSELAGTDVTAYFPIPFT